LRRYKIEQTRLRYFYKKQAYKYLAWLHLLCPT